MKATVINPSFTTLKSECLILSVNNKRKLSSSGRQLDRQLKGQLSNLLRAGDIDGSLGSSLLVPNYHHAIKRILLVGTGISSGQKMERVQYHQMIQVAAKLIAPYQLKSACSLLHEVAVKNYDDALKIQHTILNFRQILYRFQPLKAPKKTAALSQLNIVYHGDQQSAIKKIVRQATTIADNMDFAKHLANLPANVCTPSYLQKQATQLAKKHAKITAKSLNESDMKKLGMGCLLSVSQGSEEAAKLITLRYQGTHKQQAPIALVGKGVTFDSGGYSLKTPTAMLGMKYDMCGAATVIALLQLVATLKLNINIVGVIAATENLINGKATRPGDIVTSLSGKTIEILNTDAEGRLVLCDALTYCQRFKPRAVIDIATLTGATIIALGHEHSALFSNQNTLTKQLLDSGQAMNDYAWQLPLSEESDVLIRGKISDLKNSLDGNARTASSIVAARFLSHFTQDYNWAHLDVAGTAFQHTDASLGATGRPIPLLAHYLIQQSEQKNNAR